jgi:hypothetical protein
MVGIVTLVVALFLSLVITRLATTALVLTGLSREAARFQAFSAFTGTGFTTGEAEGVVTHPVRRRIILLLMILHGAGLVTLVVSLLLTFMGTSTALGWLTKLGWLVLACCIFGLVARSKLVDRELSLGINWALRRWTDLDARDYVSLLDLGGKYTVREMQVQEGDWLAGKTLKACRLPDAGVTVLGIYHGAHGYVGVPTGETQVCAQDVLVLYGHSDALAKLERGADVQAAGPPGAADAASPTEPPKG